MCWLLIHQLFHVLQVVCVGVNVPRYVALQHARPWLVHAYRNLRGRGLHQEEETVTNPHFRLVGEVCQ